MSSLLQPSLRPDLSGAPIYSAGSAFWVAFLGGPFAITAYAALNSRRLGRFGRDAAVYAGTLLLFLGAFGAGIADPSLLGIEHFTPGERMPPYPRLLVRAAGLAMWLAYYLLHRAEHRAMRLTGAAPPSPWKPAIACIVLGSIPLFALGAWLAASAAGASAA